MAKRSGFSVKITAFIEADAKNIESMNGAMQSISIIGEAFTTHGFRDLKVESRFMLSRELPDEPKAAQAGHTIVVPIELTPEPTLTYEQDTPMPPIPASLKR